MTWLERVDLVGETLAWLGLLAVVLWGLSVPFVRGFRRRRRQRRRMAEFVKGIGEETRPDGCRFLDRRYDPQD